MWGTMQGTDRMRKVHVGALLAVSISIATAATASPRLERDGDGRILAARELSRRSGCAVASLTGTVGALTHELGALSGFRFKHRFGESYISVHWAHIAQASRDVADYVSGMLEPGAELTLTILGCGAGSRIEVLAGIEDKAAAIPPSPAAAVPSRKPGTITGRLQFPSDMVPFQTVCAEPVDGGAEICRNVRDGGRRNAYRIQVPPGRYHVYARLTDPTDSPGMGRRKAYWNEYVRCGGHVRCTSTAKIPVEVGPGQTVRGVDPADWYTQP
jgi:hypothetical protein